MPVAHDLRGVLEVKPFRRLWIALSLSSLGDWLGLLATTALAYDLEGGASAGSFAVGGVFFFRLLPALVLGPFAGAFADRFDRRKQMVVCDIIRCLLFVSIPLVGTLWYLLAASFLIESVSLFWIPAKEASVPNLLPRYRLEAANQLSLITTYGSAPIASFLFVLISKFSDALGSTISFFNTNPTDLALYLNAGTFLVSAGTVFRLREISGHHEARLQATAGETSVFRAIAEGWQFVRGTRLLRGLLVGMLGAFAAGGCVVALAKPYAALFNGGNAGYGALFGAIFTGLAVGMFVGPRLLRDLSRYRLFGVAIVLGGISLSVLAFMPNIVVAVLATVVVGGFAGVAWVIGYTLIGGEVEDAVRGRTFALVQSLVRVDLLLVIAAAPIIAGAVGSHHVNVGTLFTIRLDGVTLTLFASGLLGVLVGVLSYRQMNDSTVPLWRDVLASLGRLPSVGSRAEGGFFVVFEGGEGAGKSTQVRLLRDWLSTRGLDVVVTREPGATALGSQVRALLLDPSSRISARAEALLYAADRADHVEKVICPALARGDVVISDRYVDSSLAYQGAGRDLQTEDVARISRWATDGLTPDLTVLLDVSPLTGLDRAGTTPDRLEAEPVEFHHRVQHGFRELAERDPRRYLIVDATLPVDEVARRVRDKVAEMLPGAVETQSMPAQPGDPDAATASVPIGES